MSHGDHPAADPALREASQGAFSKLWRRVVRCLRVVVRGPEFEERQTERDRLEAKYEAENTYMIRHLSVDDAKQLYDEVCVNVRTTDDISFKLLGFVPLVSGS